MAAPLRPCNDGSPVRLLTIGQLWPILATLPPLALCMPFGGDKIGFRDSGATHLLVVLVEPWTVQFY